MKAFMAILVSVLTTVLTVALVLGMSWGAVLLISWLITLCFGLEWSLLIGTGVWLCCMLIRFSVGAADDKKGLGL
ncbi:hypothetical protein [Adlercreutzia mucosicola]|uniref:hypothetical protein n=2 Tax=Adlercreutzia mucosicola TaxID=580026 RepID=UPI000402B5F6|nr:hypothetical protein [Adlercreutzia mucosicola]